MHVYAKALKSQIDRLPFELCYGCQQGRSDRVAHNVCQMTCVRSKVELCLIYALDRVEDSKVMESYAEQMGLAALEWLEVYDYDYRHNVWMRTESWKGDMVRLIMAQVEGSSC